ncbi:hypothetical protein [Campylobacter majalis]
MQYVKLLKTTFKDCEKFIKYREGIGQMMGVLSGFSRGYYKLLIMARVKF